MTENIYALHGLRRKRGELAGRLMTLETQIKTLRDDLAAVDRSIRLMDPNCVPARIKPIRPRLRYRFFPATELPRLLMDMFRKATEPLAIHTLVNDAMRFKELDPEHRDTRLAVERRIRAALLRMENKHFIERHGRGSDAAWSLKG